MKRSFGYALIFTLLSVPAFAAKNSQSITFPNAVTVGNTTLPAGDYKLTWTGTAPNVQVTIEQKDASHPATATVPATLIEQKHDRIEFTTNTQSGAAALENIDLKNMSLTFTKAPAPTPGQ